MKKVLLWYCCLLMVFGSWAQAAPTPQCVGNPQIVVKGDTPLRIFGKNWKSELLKYGISDPKKMPVGLRVCVAGTTSVSSGVESKEFLWKKPGGAPVKGCGGLTEEASNEAAWAAHGIPEADRQELRRLMATKSFDNRILEPGERFTEMSSCSKQGRIVVRKNVVAAWSKETSVPARIITLPNGKRWAWVRNCSNWLPLPSIPQPVAVVHKIQEVVLMKNEQVAQAACDEWNVRAGAGVERSVAEAARTTAYYADAEVGACPFTWKSNNGRTYNEALFVARGHMAHDYYQGWRGNQTLLLAGLGLRTSHDDHSGALYRLMLGVRTNEGSQGKYSHDARWNTFALFGTHYSIGKDGEDETHYRWGFALPFGKVRGQAKWAGSRLDEMPRWNGSVEVGVRRFLTKQGEDLRWFLELNGSVVSPDYAGVAPRVGACVLDDTICVLAGVNVGLYPDPGVAAAIGVQVDTPGVLHFTRDGTRITQVAQAAEIHGVTFEFSQSDLQGPGKDAKKQTGAGEGTVFEIVTEPDPSQ